VLKLVKVVNSGIIREDEQKDVKTREVAELRKTSEKT